MNRATIFVLCLVVFLVGPAATAQADSATQLPFPTGRAAWIAVDPAGGHVFVTDGAGTSSIVVLNYAGQIVKTINGEGGASQMALDSATHTLYVALHDSTAISEINTQTLTETTRFSTAPYPDPTSLVIAGNKLWFSCFQGDGTNCNGSVATANLNGTGVTTGVSGWFFATVLASGGAGNNLLAVADTYQEPSAVKVYNVSGGTPILVSSLAFSQEPAFVNAMAFDPSGANLFLTANNPGAVESFATSTMTPSGQYPTGPYPLGLALTADGKFIAGGVNTGTGSGNDIFVYPNGSTMPVRTWALGSGVPGLLAHSLAFTPDASRLFAVTNGSKGHLEFNVLLKPTVHLTVTRTSLTRSAKSVRYGHAMTLKAHVRGTRRGKVDLYATTSSNVRKLVAKRAVKKGVAAFKVKPRQNTTYSAELEQGSSYASSTSKDVVIGVTPVVIVRVQPGGKVQYQGHRVSRTWLPGTVRPKRPAPEPLRYLVERHEGGSWLTVVNSTFPIESDGVAHVFFLTNHPGSCRVQVTYPGDTTYAGARSGWKSFACT